MVHYQLRVAGKVQGVGYRAFVSRMAINFALKGFVKNMPDGTVYIEAEGDREVLDQFVQKCKQGPGWANVGQINLIQAPLIGYEDFRVRY